MQAVVFLLIGILLYLLSDQILKLIESRLGRRLEQRSVVFFGILLVSAMITFTAIESYFSG